MESEDAPGPDFPVMDAIPADPGEPTADLLEPVEAAPTEPMAADDHATEAVPGVDIESLSVEEPGAPIGTEEAGPVVEYQPTVEEPAVSVEPQSVEGSSSEEPTPAQPVEAVEAEFPPGDREPPLVPPSLEEAVAEAGAETDEVGPVTETPAIEEPVSLTEPAAPDEMPPPSVVEHEPTLEINPVADSSLVTHVEEMTLGSGPSDPSGVVGTSVFVDEPIELEAQSPPEADHAADLLRGMATEGPIEGGPADAAVEPAAAPGMPSTDVVTETMAEVYLKQGLIDEARDIYRRLAAQRPNDSAIRARLADLEARQEARVEPMPAAPRYSAAFTRGTSTRVFLAGVLSASTGRATEGEEPPPPSAATEPTPIDSAFGAGAEVPGTPTQPAPDGVSLASAFGDERTSAVPTESAPPPGQGGMSFDDFFGGAPPAGPAEQSPDTPSEEPEGESDDQFKDWLKGLKS